MSRVGSTPISLPSGVDVNVSGSTVEVKGPNDRLSDSQVAWIDVLVRAGAEVEVCRVERA